MLRNPFRTDPRRLNLRCEILQPTNERTETRNTLGRFYVVGKRWFGEIHLGGEDRDYGEQDVAIGTRRILLRRDDTIQPGWAIRYPVGESGEVLQIQTVDILDNCDRQYMTARVEVRRSVTVVDMDA